MKYNPTDNQTQHNSTKEVVIRYFTAERLAAYLAQQTGGRVETIGKDKYRISGVHAGGLEIETRDGRAVWHLHAESRGGDCFAAFEHFENITGFPEQLKRGAEIAGIDLPTNGNGHKVPKGKAEAVYPYTDADGNLVREKRRFPGKRFVWFHPEGGQLVTGGGDAPPLLYRLPEVIEAAGKGGRVWIVEGEKDADTMAAKGQTATTGEHGAGPDKWRPEYTEALRGAHCVIVADADKQGRSYAVQIAAALHGAAASVRLIETPKGKDASAYFETGGTLPDLVALADNSPEWMPEDERVSSWTEAAARIGEITWSWPGWMPNGLLTMLVSESGKGKSALALRIAACFIRGDNWPDGSPFTGERGKVVWCESEGALSVNVDRARKAGVPFEHMLSPLADPLEEFSIDSPEHIERLRAMAARPDVQCIILDSLSGATQQDENSSAMLHSVKKLAAIAAESGKAFLLLHHLNKGLSDGDGVHQRQIRGSSAIIQTARVIWAIDSPDETDDLHRRLSVVKNNLAPYAPPIGFRIADGGITFTNNAPRKRRPETVADKAKEFLLSALEHGARRSAEVQQEAEEAGISRRSFFDARDQLGIVAVKKQDGGKYVWFMSLPARQQEIQEYQGTPP